MCGGGSSGSSGGVPVTLLSDFFLMFFLWAFGEELEELLELVTVSPELHEKKKIKDGACKNIFYFDVGSFFFLNQTLGLLIKFYNLLYLKNCSNHTICRFFFLFWWCVYGTCFLDT